MEKQKQYEKLLDTITNISLQADDIKSMLSSVLDEILHFFQADRAWFLNPCDPDAPTWRVPMERTRPGWPGAFAMEENIPMDESLSQAFRQALTSRDVWCFGPGYMEVPQFVQECFSVKAQMGVVIHPKVGKPWIFGIHHCEEAYTYSDEDIHYFRGFGKQIAQALGNLILLEQLRDSEMFSRSLFRGSPSGLSLCDMEGNILDVNKAYTELVGYNYQECKALHFTDLTPPEYQHLHEEMVRSLLINGSYDQIEKECIKKNGERIRVQLSGSLIQRNRESFVLSSVKDITQRKKYERLQKQQKELLEKEIKERTEALSQAQADLLHKDRLALIGQLTAAVSHELRNPLGAIQPSVYYLRQRLATQHCDQGIIDALDRIERSVQRSDHIIDELVDFTRSNHLNVQAVDVDVWLRTLTENYPFPSDVHIEFFPGLKGLKLDMDVSRMHRALYHILENACEAFKDKDENARIVISTGVKRHRVTVCVSDSGAGISANVIANMFEPLFSTKGFGVGLGMPTVKNISELHGGGVEVDSQEGRGTNVTIWLPLPTKLDS